MFSKYYKFNLKSEVTVRISATSVLQFFLKLREWDTDRLITVRRGTNTLLQVVIKLPKGDYKIEIGTQETKPNPFEFGYEILWVDNANYNISEDGRTCEPYGSGSSRSIITEPYITDKFYIELDPLSNSPWDNYKKYWYLGLLWGDTPFNTSSDSNTDDPLYSYWSYSENSPSADVSAYHRNGSSVVANESWGLFNTVRMAVDPSSGNVWYGRESSWNEPGADPANGINPSFTVTNGEQICRVTAYMGNNTTVYIPWRTSAYIPISRVPEGFNTTYATYPNIVPEDKFTVKYEVLG